MQTIGLSVSEWAEVNFGTCQLGDVRRTRRAVLVAQQMAAHPDGSTPDQTQRWADLKAAYRLFDQQEVTFPALAEPHWRATRHAARGLVLLLGDTMETNLSLSRDVKGLGPTGNGSTQGFFLHSSLMVEAASGQILGLAGQELYYRQAVDPEENTFQQSQRPRESEVWGRVIDQVGPPAAETHYVHVFDRGADNLDVFAHLIEQQCEWVIRAAQLRRTVWTVGDEATGDETTGGERTNVQSLLSRQLVLGTYELEIRRRRNMPPRTARLEVRATRATIRKPKRMTPYLKQVGFEEVTQGLIEVREVDPPSGVTPLRWVLWTSLPVDSFDDAWQIIEFYEQRWLIEEFHKAMKTGCRLESRQYASAHRLEAVTGLMSVLAVRLVQLKTLSRVHPDLPAADVVPKVWLEMLRALRRSPQITTLRQFFHHLAGLGGFLMRTSDGEPGWMTLWKGTEKLTLAIQGFQALKNKCG